MFFKRGGTLIGEASSAIVKGKVCLMVGGALARFPWRRPAAETVAVPTRG